MSSDITISQTITVLPTSSSGTIHYTVLCKHVIYTVAIAPTDESIQLVIISTGTTAVGICILCTVLIISVLCTVYVLKRRKHIEGTVIYTVYILMIY